LLVLNKSFAARAIFRFRPPLYPSTTYCFLQVPRQDLAAGRGEHKEQAMPADATLTTPSTHARLRRRHGSSPFSNGAWYRNTARDLAAPAVVAPASWQADAGGPASTALQRAVRWVGPHITRSAEAVKTTVRGAALLLLGGAFLFGGLGRLLDVGMATGVMGHLGAGPAVAASGAEMLVELAALILLLLGIHRWAGALVLAAVTFFAAYAASAVGASVVLPARLPVSDSFAFQIAVAVGFLLLAWADFRRSSMG
jgi:uncharacterized membrane protein YphA (DoxX/SURF4 family)